MMEECAAECSAWLQFNEMPVLSTRHKRLIKFNSKLAHLCKKYKEYKLLDLWCMQSHLAQCSVWRMGHVTNCEGTIPSARSQFLPRQVNFGCKLEINFQGVTSAILTEQRNEITVFSRCAKSLVFVSCFNALVTSR